MASYRSIFSSTISVLLFATACGEEVSDPRSIGPDREGVITAIPEADASREVDDAPDAGAAQSDGGGGQADAGGEPGQPANLPVPRRWPEEQRLTNDVDRDLEALLEHDALEGACDAYAAGQRDELTKMRCGKWIFFYESFGAPGVPTSLMEFLQTYYADTYYGQGFSNFGMIPDPYSDTGMPLGLAPSTAEGAPSLAFTCASCHFGQLPDGRYAVGYGNMDYDYGGLIATLGAPLAMSLDEDNEDVHPDIRAELLEPVRAAKQQSGYMISAATIGLQLLDSGADGQLSIEEQGRYKTLRPGTMDFLTPPLRDDGVWTVSRILPLWNLPTAEMREAYGMEHDMLSWTGISPSLGVFVEGFVSLGSVDTAEWTEERTAPLTAYVRSLRTPPMEVFPDAAAVERGAAHFFEAGCAECHAGPSGEGTRLFEFEEIGTDEAMRWIYNPDPDGNCTFVGEGVEPGCVVTGQLKAPRLTGLQQQTKFLHNGSVDSLEQLLCLQARPTSELEAQGSGGHTFGCESLNEAERVDLIAYLTSL